MGNDRYQMTLEEIPGIILDTIIQTFTDMHMSFRSLKS